MYDSYFHYSVVFPVLFEWYSDIKDNTEPGVTPVKAGNDIDDHLPKNFSLQFK